MNQQLIQPEESELVTSNGTKVAEDQSTSSLLSSRQFR